MNTIFNQEGKLTQKDFYPPNEKTILSYKRRINERWAKKGASIKRITTQYSILLGLGLVGLVAQVHA